MNQLRIGFFEITYKFFHTYIFLFAGMEGFEPPSTVLETAILPLNYARSKSQQMTKRLSAGLIIYYYNLFPIIIYYYNNYLSIIIFYLLYF